MKLVFGPFEIRYDTRLKRPLYSIYKNGFTVYEASSIGDSDVIFYNLEGAKVFVKDCLLRDNSTKKSFK